MEPIKILLVDDEEHIRLLFREELEEEGYDIGLASNGFEALERLRAQQYDLVVLDIKMPGANGLEVLRYIKKNSAQTEVVMMTGMSDVNMAVEAMKLGAKEYLTKPIDMDQLVPQLKGIIRARDAEDRIRRLQSEHTARLLYDLHNPIAGLRQSIGYLLKGMAGSLGDHQKELLGYMTTSIDKVIDLLTDMMDLTKLEGGRVRLNKGISSLGTSVQNITQEFHVPIQSSNITLDFYAEPDLPTLEYDAEKIEQVVKNFMSNAVTHTPPQGAIVVQVRKVALVLEEGQQPTDHVMVSVFNSGKGIPSEELPLIFDRYRDLVSGKSNQNKMSGLGLVISQRIIEAHNGKIWVESEIGKGATFHFALPLR